MTTNTNPTQMTYIDKERSVGELTFEIQVLQNRVHQLRQSIQQSNQCIVPYNGVTVVHYMDDQVLNTAVNSWLNTPYS